MPGQYWSASFTAQAMSIVSVRSLPRQSYFKVTSLNLYSGLGKSTGVLKHDMLPHDERIACRLEWSGTTIVLAHSCLGELYFENHNEECGTD